MRPTTTTKRGRGETTDRRARRALDVAAAAVARSLARRPGGRVLSRDEDWRSIVGRERRDGSRRSRALARPTALPLARASDRNPDDRLAAPTLAM